MEEYVGLAFWKAAPDTIRAEARAALSDVVHAHIDELVSVFYSAFLHHAEGSPFLSHSVVHERLSHSMADWLRQLVDTDLSADFDQFVALQTRIGAIHARIKVPNHLVMQGASLLKSPIAAHLLERREAADATPALLLLDETVDFAICLMSEAYVTGARDRAQVDEAFRHFALGQDFNLERETQRASLMEWGQSVLFNLLSSEERQDAPKLGASPFGLWVRHRAEILFQGSPIMSRLQDVIHTIDTVAVPAVMEARPRSLEALGALQDRIEEAKFLLNDLFQAAGSVENGRDPLTRALNRRFLPSVLSREIALAKRNDLPLSVALVDVDHFKRINDQFGHPVGDLVLGHVATTLLDAVRSSDFVFRYGGEEFLIVFAETDIVEATVIAQRICAEFGRKPVELPELGPIAPTVSIGVAAFEGHPDYEYLIHAADTALYQAKESGRNRVVASALAA